MRFFNRATLQTPESVELEFTLAGIGNRAFALIIDYTILAVTIVGLLFLAVAVSSELTQIVIQLRGTADNVELWLGAIVLLTCFTLYVGYFVFFEALWQGQTPGKRWAKIRVIQDDGRPVSLGQASLRALLRPMDDILSIGALLIMFSPKEKRLGDLIAGTLVVQEERSNVTKTGIILDAKAQEIADQLVQLSDIAQMLPDDFAVIREYLQRRSLMEQKARSEASLKLARQVKEIVSLKTLPTAMTSDLFLEAAYLAYQQQGGQPES